MSVEQRTRQQDRVGGHRLVPEQEVLRRGALRTDLEPLEVRLFPVSRTLLGPPDASVWASRRSVVESALGSGASDAARWLGRDYLDTLTAYEAEAKKAGSSFVEIQHTMLFATVGQKVD